MSDIYAVRTNQKLEFARLHIRELERAEESSQWSKHAKIESYHESILFFMASGYAALLRENAENYRLNVARVDRFYDLTEQLEQTGQESPEVEELEQLERDRGSWLHKMLHAYDACWQAEARRQAHTEPDSSVSAIHVVQINPNHAEDRDVLAEYRGWLQAFRELVERLRSGMQEW
jgi:hypothetical protein